MTNNKTKGLVKNTMIVSIGKVCTQLLSFLLLPLYTTYLSTTEYGIVDLVSTISTLIVPFITLQLDQGIFRFLIDVRQNDEKKRIVISTTFLFLVFQVFIYTIIFFILSFFINNRYKYFLLGYLIANSFTNLLLQIARGLGCNDKYTIGSFLYATIGVILNVIFIAGLKLNANGMLLATIIGYIVCCLYLFFANNLKKYIKLENFNKSVLKELIKYSAPLISNAISWWVVNASDRIIVSTFLGVAINGVYSVANKFSSIITTVFGIFNITWTEAAAIYYEEKDRDEFFNKVYDATIRLFGALCIGIIVCMPIIFPIFIDSKYEEAYNQIPILIIATFFNVLVSFLGSIYVAKKKSKEIAKTSIFAAIINIIAHLILIRYIKLYAASISTLLAWFSMYLYRYVDSKKYVKLHNNKIIFSLLLILLLDTISYYINNINISILMLIITVTYSILINMRNIKLLIELMKNKCKNIIKKKEKN